MADGEPLCWIIVPHDVVRGTQDGALAACWALQDANILARADSPEEARAAAQRLAQARGEAVSVLAVSLFETVNPEANGGRP